MSQVQQVAKVVDGPRHGRPRCLSRTLVWCFIVAATAGLGAGCKKNVAVEPKIPTVTVSKPVQKEITEYVDFTGRTDAVEAVDVYCYPMVTGFLDRLALPYTEGAMVQQDQVLFQIDPQPYQLAVNKAEATVKSSTTALDLANLVLDNALKANEKFPGTVAKQEVDQDRAAVDNARAQLDAAKSNLDVARYNLRKTAVTAPITGQISRYYYTPGNLVTSQTKLTTIVKVDPMYVYFDVDEPTLLRIKEMRQEEEDKMKAADPDFGKRVLISQNFYLLRQLIVRNQPTHVLMSVPGDKGPQKTNKASSGDNKARSGDVAKGPDEDHWYQGEINFINNQVNSSTGSISMRGLFKNARPVHADGSRGERLLKPGMFVRVRLPIGGEHPALLIDDKAIGSDQGKKFVWLVVEVENKDGKKEKVAKKKMIETGQLQPKGLREIRSGLTENDEIIIEGSLKAEEGKPVAPSEAKPKPEKK